MYNNLHIKKHCILWVECSLFENTNLQRKNELTTFFFLAYKFLYIHS